ncbi:PstS family phosphate ABC transporter substrate-binding protein [Aliikangiella coralliicola]|uniref:PstS family phosphate ABC transporter substrate-binding protein n=1 Tax=Aliikangiella coralliicola TaxID=2592383 RepID=A0A545UHL0_9GAMM|nr:PstS family phosphate ABC transporter substrate-binding protein [Aliikangiella coralliicola]TQV88938.1 PstS family phosphate ABC transporter substrate-binding protein [Aliikangiella coralliicola]
MKKSLIILSMVAASSNLMAAGRDTINVVGSSTVYPFSTVVAERFGKNTDFKTPKIESTGTGGGMKLFCAGTGVDTPDMSNASRRMKKSELEMCQKNGVKSITEVLVGYDGIVISNSKASKQFSISRKELFLALAKEIPAKDGSETLIANPYKKWNEINPDLPATKIEVLGPPPTSGTRDAFAELVLEGGCKKFPWIKAMKKKNKKKYKTICHAVREDHVYIEAGENDNLIVQKLTNNPDALGIFGFSFLDQNSDKLQGSMVDGKEPSFEAIADGSYPVSRPLYFYVKNAHVGKVPGIKEFLKEYTSEASMGDEGYLTDKGLIPLGEEKLNSIRKDVLSLKSLKL